VNLGCINGFIEPDRFVFRFPSKFGCSVDSLFFSKPSKDLGLLRGNPTLLCLLSRQLELSSAVVIQAGFRVPLASGATE
jgi:hypothetical protein